ncbi:hypothetical protein TEA_022686 [Camellia sinensis var. sinensis]|uniref:Uncharacterized protein n=1 Tax=Camellia sinensis var. sinensis TaxID=542762 RepID=A0A4S4EUQ1_CAMSN|nr:hypothetical protein TEA_022686 [Camellia sinensis var. sinensis]
MVPTLQWQPCSGPHLIGASTVGCVVCSGFGVIGASNVGYLFCFGFPCFLFLCFVGSLVPHQLGDSFLLMAIDTLPPCKLRFMVLLVLGLFFFAFFVVVEHGLGELPFTEKQVVTPTGNSGQPPKRSEVSRSSNGEDDQEWPQISEMHSRTMSWPEASFEMCKNSSITLESGNGFDFDR